MADADRRHAEVLAEYKALRDEVLARIGMRNQIVNFAVIVLAAVLAVSARDGVVAGGTAPAAPAALLAYPILAFFLARGWVNHDIRIGEIGKYIRTVIEPGCGELKWDGYLYTLYQSERPWVRREAFFATGLFAVTPLLVILLAVPPPPLTPTTWCFLALDGLAIGWTILSVGQRSMFVHAAAPASPGGTAGAVRRVWRRLLAARRHPPATASPPAANGPATGVTGDRLGTPPRPDGAAR